MIWGERGLPALLGFFKTIGQREKM